jgi:hypothetical protein
MSISLPSLVRKILSFTKVVFENKNIMLMIDNYL